MLQQCLYFEHESRGNNGKPSPNSCHRRLVPRALKRSTNHQKLYCANLCVHDRHHFYSLFYYLYTELSFFIWPASFSETAQQETPFGFPKISPALLYSTKFVERKRKKKNDVEMFSHNRHKVKQSTTAFHHTRHFRTNFNVFLCISGKNNSVFP